MEGPLLELEPLLAAGPPLVEEPLQPQVRRCRHCHCLISTLPSALSLRHTLTPAPSNRPPSNAPPSNALPNAG
jgi:hypothetical protein